MVEFKVIIRSVRRVEQSATKKGETSEKKVDLYFADVHWAQQQKTYVQHDPNTHWIPDANREALYTFRSVGSPAIANGA
jgi:hypothetical protein